MQKYTIMARPEDIVAVKSDDNKTIKSYQHKGYGIIGRAKINDGFDVMGVRIVKGGER